MQRFKALQRALRADVVRVSNGRDKDRLDRVHSVFRLIEDERSFRFKDRVGDLHAAKTELLCNAGSCLCAVIMESGQAMHELAMRIFGGLHDIRPDAERR